MATTVQCTRCGNEREALPNPPFRAGTKLEALGREVQEKICKACYKEWLDMSVKLVNETRMDTTDPRGQQLWLDQMRAFLNLGGGEGGAADPWARFLNQRVRVETTAGTKAVATLIGADPSALNFAEFDGGGVPDGFKPSATGARGSASIARDAVRTIESAA
jgi:Fe-S cluster biosynthesis and repair protein YggX